MDYENMLERGRKGLPNETLKSDRFEIPKVVGHIQGNRTIISNFYQIAQALRRDVNHLTKYILKELAAPGELSKTALMLGTKISASRVNEKIQQYVKDFVVCRECGKPDTKLVKEERTTIIKCEVCGARHAIRKLVQ